MFRAANRLVSIDVSQSAPILAMWHVLFMNNSVLQKRVFGVLGEGQNFLKALRAWEMSAKGSHTLLAIVG